MDISAKTPKHIEKDNYWDVFEIADYNIFREKFLPEIYLRPEVHEDVKESFRIIQRLLEFGFYEHRFFEVAYTKALLTLEMAFKQRYMEVKGKVWEGDLRPLMGWLKKNNLFDVYNSHFMDGLGDIRNHFAHPTIGSFTGVGRKNLILYPMDLINGLYEDRILTQERITKGKQFFKKIQKMGIGLKITIDGEPHFAFNIWLAFYDNKSIPIKVHVYFQPVFELPDLNIPEEALPMSPCYYWQASALIFEEENIKLPDTNGKILEISPITCYQEQQTFLKWQKQYNEYDLRTDDRLRKTNYATETFEYYLRAFHRL